MAVNSYVLYKYFVADSQFDDIKAFLSVAAFDGLYNHFDEPTLPMRMPSTSSSSASGAPQNTPVAAVRAR
eukprot:5875501-Pleurochrysis_carterae.AAC.1